MRRLVIKSNNQYIANDLHGRNKSRGAQVFGMPVSPAINSYIDDVSPQSRQERMLAMFFAGNYSGFEDPDAFDDCDDIDDNTYSLERDF